MCDSHSPCECSDLAIHLYLFNDDKNFLSFLSGLSFSHSGVDLVSTAQTVSWFVPMARLVPTASARVSASTTPLVLSQTGRVIARPDSLEEGVMGHVPCISMEASVRSDASVRTLENVIR